MRTRFSPGACWPAAFLLLPVMGCGQSLQDVPTTRIRAQVGSMSVEALQTKAREYRQAYLDSQQRLQEVRTKMAAQEVSRQSASRLRALAEQSREISRTMGALLERYRIYIEELTRRKVDIKDLEIP